MDDPRHRARRRGLHLTDALAEALGVLLPRTDSTLLLRAALLDGERARTAWSTATAGACAAKTRDLLAAHHHLLPLLSASHARNGLDIDGPTLTALRTAMAREALRTERMLEGCAEVGEAISRHGIATVVLGEMAVAATYPDAALRHCHGLSLGVDPGAMDAAAAAAIDAAVVTRADQGARSGIHLVHRLGFPVSLHPSGAAAPSSGALLAEVACEGSEPATRACDGFHLLTSVAPGELADLPAEARQRDAAALVASLVQYLVAHLGVEVADGVRAGLDTAASNATDLERDRALALARLTAGDRVMPLLRAVARPIDRARVFAWLALPSSAYLREIESSRAARFVRYLGVRTRRTQTRQG